MIEEEVEEVEEEVEEVEEAEEDEVEEEDRELSNMRSSLFFGNPPIVVCCSCRYFLVSILLTNICTVASLILHLNRLCFHPSRDHHSSSIIPRIRGTPCIIYRYLSYYIF